MPGIISWFYNFFYVKKDICGWCDAELDKFANKFEYITPSDKQILCENCSKLIKSDLILILRKRQE